MMNLAEFKDFLGRNPAYLATTDLNGRPNLTIVRAKVLNDRELLIADVQMEKCRNNLLLNPNCCLVSYKEDERIGLKIVGKAKYYNSGSYFEEAQELAKKRNYEAVGALVVSVDELMC